MNACQARIKKSRCGGGEGGNPGFLREAKRYIEV